MAQRIRNASAMIACRGRCWLRGGGSGGPQEPDQGAFRRPVDDGQRGHARGQDPRRCCPRDSRSRRTAWARSPSGSDGAAGPTLVLAALDGYGHMVSGITPEGYLTLDRPVPPPHARFDAFLLGQPVDRLDGQGPGPRASSPSPPSTS
ncbi:MAG: hypothetical protein M0C28_20540 [Candidatus Moduliflexus flocculans]|nr:hypothetical protein [Candidatus Moduliflexus flocculans]